MKQANPKLVGIFVIGGIVLAVGAVVLFSSQDLFTPKRQFVAYFQQSVNGLNVGAPVRFRGIPIGEVKKIEGVFNADKGIMIPRLLLEVRPETMADAVLVEGEYNLFPMLVKSGMRASLKSASLLTGQLYVSMDFYPDEPVRTLGDGREGYPEMPTIDSGLDEAIAKLSDLPIQELMARAADTLIAAEAFLRNPDLAQSFASIPPLLENANHSVDDLRKLINQDVAGLVSHTGAAMDDVRKLVAGADNTLADLDAVVNRDVVNLLANSNATVGDLRAYLKKDLTPLTGEAGRTLKDTRAALTELTGVVKNKSLAEVSQTMGEFDNTLKLVQQRLSQDDVLILEILTTLRELGSAARSMRELTDNLKQNPEWLIRGKTQ